MRTALDRKGKRFMRHFLGIPLFIILAVINIVLISWLCHMVYASFVNDFDHMSLSHWAEHLYMIIKAFIDQILRI